MSKIKKGDIVRWVSMRGRTTSLRGIVLEEVALLSPEYYEGMPDLDTDGLRVRWFSDKGVTTRLRRCHTKVEVEGA